MSAQYTHVGNLVKKKKRTMAIYASDVTRDVTKTYVDYYNNERMRLK